MDSKWTLYRYDPERESNPDIKKWMAAHNYTDYSKLEQYYETT